MYLACGRTGRLTECYGCGENSILQKESSLGMLSEEGRNRFQAVTQPSLIESSLHLLLVYFASHLVLNILGATFLFKD